MNPKEKIDLFTQPTKELFELVVSQMDLSAQEKEIVSERISKMDWSFPSSLSLADKLFLITPNYQLIKKFLSNDDCLKILELKSADGQLKPTNSLWAVRDFEIVGDFFLDVAQRAKTEEKLAGYLSSKERCVQLTAGIMRIAANCKTFSKESFSRGLEKIKKARKFKGGVKDLIASDICFIANQETKPAEDYRTTVLTNCLLQDQPVLHEAAIMAFESLRGSKNNAFKNFIDDEKNSGCFILRDFFKIATEKKDFDLLHKTVSLLEDAEVIRKYDDHDAYSGLFIEAYSNVGLDDAEPTQITQDFKNLLNLDHLSGLREIRNSAIQNEKADNKLSKEGLQTIRKTLLASYPGSISIYDFSVKEILLLFKEIEKFDKNLVESEGFRPIRAGTKIASSLCTVAKLMGESRIEKGLDDFSQSKELPSFEIIEHFRQITLEAFDQNLKSRPVIPKRIKEINEISNFYEAFGAWLEKKYLLKAVPEPNHQSTKRLNKL